MDKSLDHCNSSTTNTHEWRAFLSGGYKCVYCGQEWVPAEVCIDPDEVGKKPWYQEQPEPLWPKIVGVIVAIILIALVFAPGGAGK